MHLTRAHAIPQVLGLSPCSSRTIGGELVDSGGNFNMTNDLSLLLNVVAIRPYILDWHDGCTGIQVIFDVHTLWGFSITDE
jgi:hypothetical protein